jgi:hypothetical protein
MSELKVPLRVRLRVSHGLHAALQLNQDYVNASCCLSGGAIAHSSLQRSGRGNQRRTAD